MPHRRIVAGVLLCVTASCTPQTGPAPGENVEPVPQVASVRGPTDVITSAELSDPSLGDADALSIIKRLRPAFLKTRGVASANTAGSEIHVLINDGPFQTTAALLTIFARDMVEIRYFGVSAAAQRYGSRAAAAPVITIRTK